MADFSENSAWIARYNGKRVPKNDQDLGTRQAPGSVFGSNSDSEKDGSSINAAVIAHWELLGRDFSGADSQYVTDRNMSTWMARKYTVNNNLYGYYGQNRNKPPGGAKSWRNYPTCVWGNHTVELVGTSSTFYNINGSIGTNPTGGKYTTFKIVYKNAGPVGYYSWIQIQVTSYFGPYNGIAMSTPYDNLYDQTIDLRTTVGGKDYNRVSTNGGTSFQTSVDDGIYICFRTDLGLPDDFDEADNWGDAQLSLNITGIPGSGNSNLGKTNDELTYNYIFDFNPIASSPGVGVCALNGNPYSNWNPNWITIDGSYLIMEFQPRTEYDCSFEKLVGLSVQVYNGSTDGHPILISGTVSVSFSSSRFSVTHRDDGITVFDIQLGSARSINGLTVNEDETPNGVQGPIFQQGYSYLIKFTRDYGLYGNQGGTFSNTVTAGPA